MTIVIIYAAISVVICVFDRRLLRGPCPDCGPRDHDHDHDRRWSTTLKFSALWPAMLVLLIVLLILRRTSRGLIAKTREDKL